ncbi:MAG: glycine betaine ABC transporter substrate-binding protein [Arhodomonas sp.]|nr:glycine betaine ABC transporter substrate-binding protein [Arhodomonas sp.]
MSPIFGDLDAHQDRFEGRIYGIEAGNDGNLMIQAMIDDDAYGLGDWELMPSSEAGMLTQVRRKVRRDEWVVYLGWAPHPMTRNIDMRFLEGGEDYFGPNQGGATVLHHRHRRLPGALPQCRAVARAVRGQRRRPEPDGRLRPQRGHGLCAGGADLRPGAPGTAGWLARGRDHLLRGFRRPARGPQGPGCGIAGSAPRAAYPQRRPEGRRFCV